MCGICGKITASDKTDIPDCLIREMCDSLKHRGPDDSGVYSGKGAVLGHRRLSIIDLSSEAAQPLTNENNTLFLAVNGEIYNYTGLRNELEKKNHRFRTNTDSEVILHLYEEYGSDCPMYLEGMFSFALWDTGKNRLFAARDISGQKPFFYHYAGEDLTFASELASLLEDSAIPREVNEKALFDYFSLYYIPAPETAYRNIFKLPPAHRLEFDRGQIKVTPYWDISYANQEFIGSEEVVAREIREKMTSSVRERLQADVDVGVFLSGGIDSGIISALAAAEDPAVTAFSVKFANEEYDESRYAELMASRLGISLKTVTVDPDVARILPELALHHGEPFADSSSIPTWSISQAASDHVKVILSGDGGDELFGGYYRYRAYMYQTLIRIVPRLILKPLLRAGEVLCGNGRRNGSRYYLRRFLRILRTRGFNYSDLLFLLTDHDKTAMMNPEYLQLLPHHNPGTKSYISHLLIASGASDLVEMSMAADFFSYLPGDLLAKVDTASMAHGLEVRSPFLSRGMIEYTASIPLQYKINGRRHKYILRKAFRDLLPSEILKRPKMGFAVPLASYLNGPLSSMTEDLLGDPSAYTRRIFRPEIVDTVLQPGEREHHAPLVYAMLMCELWHSTFIQ